MTLTDKKYIGGSGPNSPKLMVIIEAPSYQDLISGSLLSGNIGQLFNGLLKEAGINRESLWITSVCKYFVSPSTKEDKIPFSIRARNEGIDLDEQVHHLQTEINNVKPNCILALGKTALWALTGKTDITHFRGSILHGMGVKIVPTYHPKGLFFNEIAEFKGYYNKQIIIFDFKRAAIESQSPILSLPNRTLTICRSTSQFADFLDRHKGYNNPAIDIEAHGTCMPICMGVAFTPDEGITVPLWNEDGISTIHTAELVQLWIMLANMLWNNEITGQNFKYDQDKIRRFGLVIQKLKSDTMLKAFTINPELPKSLAFNTSLYTREPFYKDEGMYEGKIEDLLIGCARDSCVTKEIDLAMDKDINELGLRGFYENFIMHLHSLYLDIESEGFYIDREVRDNLFKKYIKWSEELSFELYQLTGGYTNINSPKQVAVLLYEQLKLPKRPGTGEEELTSILNLQSMAKPFEKNPDLKRIIEIILEKRRIEKTIGTYLAALPDYDGKMKTTYYLCLETGRTATSQLEPPIRPSHDKDTGLFSTKKTGRKYIGTAFQTITKHGDIGADVRSQYIPEKGHVFIQADSAQAEARVVFLLANDEWALEAIDTHDFHALTASWFFGGTEDDYSKKVLGYESPIRFVGKTLRHAGHLGASKRRASISVNTDARKFKIPITITEATADKALKIFHAKQPSIQKVFQAGIVECINKNRTLIASVPYGIDSKIGGVRTFFERSGEDLNRQAFSYIPQRSITDNTKAAALRIRKREPFLSRIILESHDSLLFMVPEKEVNYFGPIIKEEMERAIRFDTCSLPRRNLIIPCELEIGYNYMEFNKLKLPVQEVDLNFMKTVIKI